MIQVQTASRLHFGVLSVVADSLTGRQFGGVGLMIQRPGVRVRIRPAEGWRSEGPLADRALAFAHRFAQTLPPRALPPQHLSVESAAAHVGLGTGTQLGLAVARALATAAGLPNMEAPELARRVGRGARSALGIHGFERGGFLVDGGKRQADDIAPLTARVSFPEAWRIVLAIPPGQQGLHGIAESQALARFQAEITSSATTESLCRLLLLGLLPALAEHDLAAFGASLYEFNRRVGEIFARLQGGCYASAAGADLVQFLRQQGASGVGQSSWGPAVFAVVKDEEQAVSLVRRVQARFGLDAEAAFCTAAANSGAEVRHVDQDSDPDTVR